MRIIISPAKKMRVDTDSLPHRTLPVFLDQTQVLADILKEKSYDELKKLWKCNDQIAELNVSRLEHLNIRKDLTPAILSYEGIQYRYMAPHVFTDRELEYVQEHLRILSGFYGILRPFDGVTPYRLEMQAKLKAGVTLAELPEDKSSSILIVPKDSSNFFIFTPIAMYILFKAAGLTTTREVTNASGGNIDIKSSTNSSRVCIIPT